MGGGVCVVGGFDFLDIGDFGCDKKWVKVDRCCCFFIVEFGVVCGLAIGTGDAFFVPFVAVADYFLRSRLRRFVEETPAYDNCSLDENASEDCDGEKLGLGDCIGDFAPGNDDIRFLCQVGYQSGVFKISH